MKKRFLALALAVVIVVSACALVACNLAGTPEDSTAYVSLDINPAIELIVDGENNVVSVRGENEDGQVLLYEETGIIGANVNDAIKKITDLAIKYGYLDENNSVVDTLVSSDNEKFAKEVLANVNSTVTATASDLGLSVTTDGEGAYSLVRQMNEIKKEFPNNKAVQNASVEKFRLALSVSETGEITIDAALELDEAELIATLQTATEKIEQFATEAYSVAKAQALAAYDQATELASYAVYTQFYLTNVLSHPTTFYYGGIYQMYATASKGFDVVCNLAKMATSVKNYPLSEQQVAAVATALGMESVAPLKNSNGEITVSSIEAYADKLFKNSPASEKLEQTKADLTEALAQAESVIKQKVNELAEEYKPQIEAAMQVARQTLTAVQTMLSVLPSGLKTLFDQIVVDFTDILSDIETLVSGDAILLDVLEEKAARLDEKAQDYLAKIKEDLSEEEWAQVEANKATVISKMTEQKAVLEKALNDAEQAAKDYLANLKAQRTKA